jgi:hypothetical protein
MNAFPLPIGPGVVVVPAPAAGPQNWAGAPSAAYDEDGSIVLAYRLRWAGPTDANVIARSADGEHFETVVTLDKERWGAAMVERTTLIRLEGGGWRLYVCCATPNTKHWWIGLVEAQTLEGLADAEIRPIFPGDENMGVKDPVIQRRDGRWHAWICCHPLDVEDEEDRMTTGHATSTDGLEWDWHGTVLEGRPGMWDSRGARLTAVLPDGRAAYDGRATKEQNWFEQIGIAEPDGTGFTATGDALFDARYLEVLPLPAGGYRLYYEARLPDESHELRTEVVEPS